MMIDPPIEKLIDKVGCKYALVCLVTKRSRFLLDKKAEMLEAENIRAVSFAAHEVQDGKVEAGYEGV